MTDQEILSRVHDHANNALVTTASPSFVSGCCHTITEILNDVFDELTNTIRTV